MRKLLGVALATAAIATAPAAAAPVFVLNNTGGVEAGTNARRGFEMAAALWSSIFTDNVTIRLDVGFRSLASGVLGSAGSSRYEDTYQNVRSGLIADRTSATDDSATYKLKSTLSFYSNEAGNCATNVGCRPVSPSSRTKDSDGTRDNTHLMVNTSLGKAIGIRGDTGARDAAITFSTAFNWDFDRSNGITRGVFDFVGVAAHEIGHALGFVSGVDTADSYVGYTGLDNMAWGTVLDLFRYKGTSRDWTVGGTPCIKVSGSTCLGEASTGVRHGDGRQASHWKDNEGIGILDPTASTGELLEISAEDRKIYDAIGWDLASGLSASNVQWLDGASFVDADVSWLEEEIHADEFMPAQVPAAGSLGVLALGLGGLVALRRRARS